MSDFQSDTLLDLSPPVAMQHAAGYLFNQLAAIFRHHSFSNLMESLGLPPPLYAILQTLADEGPRTQSALGTRLGIDRSSLSAMCDELAKHELISRNRPDDDRAWVLEISDTGRDMAAKAHAQMTTLQQELLASLSDAEQKTLTALMTRALTQYRERATFAAMTPSADEKSRPN